MALGAPAPFSHRLAHVRPHEAALFQAVQRRINRAGRDLTASGGSDLFANGGSVRTFIGAHQGHQDDKFQFTETVSWGHMYYLTVHIDAGPTKRLGGCQRYFLTGSGGGGGTGTEAWSMTYTHLPSCIILTSVNRPSTTCGPPGVGIVILKVPHPSTASP